MMDSVHIFWDKFVSIQYVFLKDKWVKFYALYRLVNGKYNLILKTNYIYE